jgi:hypothetical protein
MALLAALLLAASFDGEAALRHASSLAALGPHPWGSSLSRGAAQYVAAQFRDAGLEEVRLEGFEVKGRAGTNVLGVLRAPGPEFVLLGAHHDTAPLAPGAYDDGGGVGVLIEVARALAHRPDRRRTIVFASFDGEEAWHTQLGTTTGSRAYVTSLGPESRNLVAAFVVEMCGWKGGTPALHPIPYADPVRPGAYAVTPAWLLRETLGAAAARQAPFVVGDRWLSWLYQPLSRSLRVDLYGDDLSFTQAGIPALFASDSTLSAFYPWYHARDDSADKLDAASLDRMGRGVLAVAEALETVRRGPPEPVWFTAFGLVLGVVPLLGLGLASLLPGLLFAWRAGRGALALRGAHALAFGVLLFRHPVPALAVLLVPNLAGLHPRLPVRLASLLPLLLLLAGGLHAWHQGFAEGWWLAPWDLGLAAAAVLLALLPAPGTGSGSKGAARPARRGRAGKKR